MSAPEPRWISSYAAFDALRKQYEASNFYANDEVCWRAANDTLLRRLQSEQLPGRAAKVSIQLDNDFLPEPSELLAPDSDGKVPVPRLFWTCFLESASINREADWLAGDFEFNLSNTNRWGESDKGVIIGLEVDANHLPLSTDSSLAIAMAQQSEPQSTRAGGRSPANWWPDFAEELAVYVHDCGIPAGQGHDGQSAMIDAIFARMVEQGKSEPGRGTVQAVINAVLRRIRSAGN